MQLIQGKRWLAIVLMVISSVTLTNLFILYWIPIPLPLASFSAIRFTFLAYAEKRYALILISFAICALLFLASLSIWKGRCLIPTISLVHFLGEIALLCPLFLDAVDTGYYYVWRYLLKMLVDAAMIVLLCVYCTGCLRSRIKKKRNAEIS